MRINTEASNALLPEEEEQVQTAPTLASPYVAPEYKGPSDDVLGRFKVEANAVEAFTTDRMQFNKMKALAAKAKVPIDLIPGNELEIETKARMDSLDLYNLERNSPLTYEFLKLGNNAKSAIYHVEEMSSFEKFWQSTGEVAEAIPESGSRGYDIGISSNLRADQMLAERLPQIYSPLSIEQQKELKESKERISVPQDGRVLFVEPFAEFVTGAGYQILFKSLFNATPFFAGALITAEVAPPLSAALATTGKAVLTGNLLYRAFKFEFGAMRNEFDTLEDVSDEMKDDAAIIGAVVNASLEYVGFSKLGSLVTGGKSFVKGRLIQALKDPTKAAIIKRLAKRYLEYIATESVTEGAQEGVNKIMGDLAQLFDNPNDPKYSPGKTYERILSKETLKAIGSGMSEGAQVAALLGGGGAVVNYTTEAKRLEDKSLVEQDKIDELVDIVSESKLKKESDETFRDFAQEVAPEVKMYLDGENAINYVNQFTDEVVAADPLLTKIKGQEERVKTFGAPVNLSAADFMTDMVGSKHFEALRPSTTMSEDTTSPARVKQQAEANKNFLDGYIKKAQALGQTYTDSQKIYDEVYAQMVDTERMDPRIAKYQAEFIPAYMAIVAAEDQINIADAWGKYFARITGPFEQRKEALREGQDQLGMILDQQDFGDIMVDQTFTREVTGEDITVTRPAGEAYKQTKERKEIFDKLVICING